MAIDKFILEHEQKKNIRVIPPKTKKAIAKYLQVSGFIFN